MSNGFFLEDGLPVTPPSLRYPDWIDYFYDFWPLNNLDSSAGSVLTFCLIIVGIAAAGFFLGILAKSYIKNWFGRVVQYIFIGISLFALFLGSTGVMLWTSTEAISDHDMGVAVTKTKNYLSSINVKATDRDAWDLVCGYYDDKNPNCRDTKPKLGVKNTAYKVVLQKGADGQVYVYDYTSGVDLSKK